MKQTILTKLYITDGLSQRAVAEALGVSHTTVRHYLKKYNIKKNKPRPVTEAGKKRCPHCDEVKPFTEFYKQLKPNGSVRTGSWCKPCMKGQVLRRQRLYKEEAVKLKGGCCRSCGFDGYIGALEFHHPDPSSKSSDIVRFSKGPQNPKVAAELNKTVLVCSNCHRAIHAGVLPCPEIIHIV